MQGLELLEVGKKYKVRTASGEHTSIEFVGFEQENPDVLLAVFTTPSTNPVIEICFDTSIPTNRVVSNH